MFKSFAEIEQYVIATGTQKRIALAGAHDAPALEAVVDARRRGVIEATLVGEQERICELLAQMGEDAGAYVIVPTTSDSETSSTAMGLVRDGKADIEMKGNLASADFLLPIMNPFDGLVDFGDLLSETTAFEFPEQGRMMFATDCAIAISPTLDQKVQLIENAVALARVFGLDEVRVASIGALERVNPQIPNTQDSHALAEMDWPEGVEVAGPFALDNALDAEAAAHKGIENPVAGKADVLLMPDLTTGNVFHKCIHYLGHMQSAAVICGTKHPVVFTSRSDSAQTKFNSILAAILQAEQS